MNRKHFLQISGASLGSLIFAKWGDAAAAQNELIQLPSAVKVLLDSGVYSLKPTSAQTWVYKDISVKLTHVNDVLKTEVSSPSEALHHVQLEWAYAQAENEKVLGDHWERTYGDVQWQTPVADKKMPWYFMQFDGKATNCFGVKTGCSSICYWQLNNATMQLIMNTRCGGDGVQLGARVLHTADIITTKSTNGESAFETGRRFCKLMCDKPCLPLQPVYGINDWYFAYGNSSADLILQHTTLLADLATDTSNRPFSVIDAGWASYSPFFPNDCCWQDDFSKPNDKFKDMQKLAADIKNLGMRPGLWTRPLCGKHDVKQTLVLPSITGRDNPKQPVLDPSIEENIEHIKSNFSIYKDWGYHMVKHDFTTYDMLGKWGFQMTDTLTQPGWHFYDQSKTTAEIILHLYKSIREAAGDMYLIGCNTISHLSAGVFELTRIGDDTSGNEWERTRKMGVNTLAFRGIQHNHFYSADADCVGLTSKVPWAKNKQWMQLLAQGGTPMFISAQPDAVGAEQKQFIKQSFTAAATVLPVAEALDWMESLTPSTWKLNGQVVKFDWS